MNDGDGREQSSLEAAALRLMRTLATSLRAVLKQRVLARACCIPPSRPIAPARHLVQSIPVRTMYDHRQPFTAAKLKVSDIHTLQCALKTISDHICITELLVLAMRYRGTKRARQVRAVSSINT